MTHGPGTCADRHHRPRWTDRQGHQGQAPQTAEADAAFRYALLNPGRPRRTDIATERTDIPAIFRRIVRRAVDTSHLRADFQAEDLLLIRRAMADMNAANDWRRDVALFLQGIRRHGNWATAGAGRVPCRCGQAGSVRSSARVSATTRALNAGSCTWAEPRIGRPFSS